MKLDEAKRLIERDQPDYWDEDDRSYDEVEKDRQALAWELNRR